MTEKEGKSVEEAKNLLFSKEDVDLCLVAKLISSKRANVDAFRNVMRSVWKVHQQTKIEAARENVFAIQFKSRMEKDQIMNTGPWMFDRSLLVMRSPNEDDQICEMRFTQTAFWIQIHSVPMNCMTIEMAKALRCSMGLVE